ncbi:MAG TPA: SpoIVB peptidase S55 domain-containing protein [Bryobacteraceae bacterium]|nr:SpoIVB peptidase S55 domain-containing protein [Bryobacteraceae bacterium]
MKGTGRTVFSGSRVEDFQVEVLGVLDNVGPKQSLILARLSGGPLASTGVMQGMSGSPVYFDGRLAGAVAMGFAFSKEPIAGIRPIEDMLRVENGPAAVRETARRAPWDGSLTSLLAPAGDLLAPGGRMVDIATPVSFGGFTRAAIEHFAPQLRSLGLEPRQGMSGGGRIQPGLGNPAALEPGAMISVQLVSGDLSIGADGTVTHIDGNRVYAFGHRFLAVGATDLPFARSEVLTLLPNLSTSFKISAAREWMGSITQDRSVAVAGQLGRRAPTIPVSISVTDRGANPPQPSSYDFRVVNDRVLAPFLLQMAVFSAIDATERTTGESSFSIAGEVEFENGATPIRLDNMYSGDLGLAAQVSLATAVPVAYAMQSGFPSLQLKRVALRIESFPRKRQLQIDQLWSSRREVRPGDTLELTVVLSGENGMEVVRKVPYRVPVGAPPGPLQITAADANIINVTEYRQLVAVPPRSAAQLVDFMNGLRANTKAYLRVWRADPAFDVQGDTLPAPPPSVGLILSRTQASLSATPALANARVAELDIPAGDMVISGSKTIQVEVKE